MPETHISRWGIPLLLLILLPFAHTLQASHIMAGDLTYRFLGGTQYEVTLKLYRDCSGVALGPTAWIQLSSSCTADSNLTLDLLPGSGQELPLLCPSEQPNSSCNGGSLVGVREFVYVDTVTLAVPCSDWNFSWTSCCRNAAITNLASPSSRGVYLEATLNNVNGPNSSPVYAAIPTPYICANQLFSYTQGTAEADGDSLVFMLSDPLENSGSPIPFASGFSPTQPFSPSLSFDSLTGAFVVTPNALQVAVLALLVKEYRNGILIGTTQRDLQVIVLSCNNTFPQLDPDSVRGLSPLASQTGPRVVEVCPGNLVSFSLQATDADAGDSVFISSNAGAATPGATFVSSPGPDTATATFSWTPAPGDVGTHLLELTVRDNHCPLLGVQRYAVLITVLSRSTAGPDLNYCNIGGPVKLQATGGASFTWTYLGGGTPPLSELSCSACAAPLASPSVTTTYVVTSDLANCVNQDTVTVTVVPDFTLSLAATPQRLCRGDSATLVGAASPGGGYTYTWSPEAGLGSPGFASTQAAPFSSTRYYLTAVAPTGCTVRDSLEVEVVHLSLNATVSQDKVCRLDSTTLLAQVSSNSPYSLNWFDPLGAFISSNDTHRYRPVITGFYRAEATDTAGVCIVEDSLHIDVLDLEVFPYFTSTCPGDSVQLDAVYSGPIGLQYPIACGPAPDSCCGPRNLHLIGDSCAYDSSLSSPGNGSRNCQFTTTLYSPYQSGVGSVRLQYLFQRSELNAAGFLGGTITQLQFYLAFAFSQGNDSINELVIKLGCTDADTLTEFLEGLTTVWGPRAYAPATGFNLHVLDRPFDWDGSGNLVVQICSKDDSIGFASNAAVYMATALPTVLRGQGGLNAPLCELTASDSAFFRPFTEFGVCVEGIQPRYSWSPTAGLSNPFIANPKAAPLSDTTYTVTVTPADGCLCELQDTARVEVDGCILGEGEILLWAEKEDSGVRLNWRLEDMQGLFRVSLERGSPGQEIETIAGLAEVHSGEWRLFRDLSPTPGLNTYRLRIEDVQGNFWFSSYSSIYWSGAATSVFPNPVFAGEEVQIRGLETQSVIWRDLTGKELSADLSPFVAPALPGLYLLESRSERSSAFFKVWVR